MCSSGYWSFHAAVYEIHRCKCPIWPEQACVHNRTTGKQVNPVLLPCRGNAAGLWKCTGSCDQHGSFSLRRTATVMKWAWHAAAMLHVKQTFGTKSRTMTRLWAGICLLLSCMWAHITWVDRMVIENMYPLPVTAALITVPLLTVSAGTKNSKKCCIDYFRYTGNLFGVCRMAIRTFHNGNMCPATTFKIFVLRDEFTTAP